MIFQAINIFFIKLTCAMTLSHDSLLLLKLERTCGWEDEKKKLVTVSLTYLSKQVSDNLILF